MFSLTFTQAFIGSSISIYIDSRTPHPSNHVVPTRRNQQHHGTKPTHPILTWTVEPSRPSASLGIDAMLGSAIFTTENDCALQKFHVFYNHQALHPHPQADPPALLHPPLDLAVSRAI
ncbi:hypothetical protein MBLNU13_g10433t1 [Cladosporium sp. NU13]